MKNVITAFLFICLLCLSQFSDFYQFETMNEEENVMSYQICEDKALNINALELYSEKSLCCIVKNPIIPIYIAKNYTQHCIEIPIPPPEFI